MDDHITSFAGIPVIIPVGYGIEDEKIAQLDDYLAYQLAGNPNIESVARMPAADRDEGDFSVEDPENRNMEHPLDNDGVKVCDTKYPKRFGTHAQRLAGQKKLHEKLWHEKLDELKKFKEEHGHCNVPSRNKKQGLSRWVEKQRELYNKTTGKQDPKVRQANTKDSPKEMKGDQANATDSPKEMKGDKYTIMTDEKIESLKAIGFDFRSAFEIKWEQHFTNLLQFKSKHGHVNVSHSKKDQEADAEHQHLASWVTTQRGEYKDYMALKEKKRDDPLKEERYARLEKLGFVWNRHDARWEEQLEMLKEYHNACGHSNVPYYHKVGDINLGQWCAKQRDNYKFLRAGKKSRLTRDRMADLIDLEFRWKPETQEYRTIGTQYNGEVTLDYRISYYGGKETEIKPSPPSEGNEATACWWRESNATTNPEANQAKSAAAVSTQATSTAVLKSPKKEPFWKQFDPTVILPRPTSAKRKDAPNSASAGTPSKKPAAEPKRKDPPKTASADTQSKKPAAKPKRKDPPKSASADTQSKKPAATLSSMAESLRIKKAGSKDRVLAPVHGRAYKCGSIDRAKKVGSIDRVLAPVYANRYIPPIGPPVPFWKQFDPTLNALAAGENARRVARQPSEQDRRIEKAKTAARVYAFSESTLNYQDRLVAQRRIRKVDEEMNKKREDQRLAALPPAERIAEEERIKTVTKDKKKLDRQEKDDKFAQFCLAALPPAEQIAEEERIKTVAEDKKKQDSQAKDKKFAQFATVTIIEVEGPTGAGGAAVKKPIGAGDAAAKKLAAKKKDANSGDVDFSRLTARQQVKYLAEQAAKKKEEEDSDKCRRPTRRTTKTTASKREASTDKITWKTASKRAAPMDKEDGASKKRRGKRQRIVLDLTKPEKEGEKERRRGII